MSLCPCADISFLHHLILHDLLLSSLEPCPITESMGHHLHTVLLQSILYIEIGNYGECLYSYLCFIASLSRQHIGPHNGQIICGLCIFGIRFFIGLLNTSAAGFGSSGPMGIEHISIKASYILVLVSNNSPLCVS